MQIQGTMVHAEQLASGYAQLHVDCGDGSGPIVGVLVPALVLIRDGMPVLGQRVEIKAMELADDHNFPSDSKPAGVAVGLSGVSDGGVFPDVGTGRHRYVFCRGESARATRLSAPV